jgi:hypothetical protein
MRFPSPTTSSAFAALLAAVAFLGLLVDVSQGQVSSGHLMWKFQANSGYAPCVVVHASLSSSCHHSHPLSSTSSQIRLPILTGHPPWASAGF